MAHRGCDYLTNILSQLKRERNIDLVIANGENSSDGNGITPHSAKLLLDSGVDIITTGNHCFRRKEMDELYETSEYIIRPANLGKDIVGKGWCLYDMGKASVAVINLMGTAFLQPIDNPFNYIDEILSEIPTKNIIVDFHAESTAEKKAMGYYLSGKVSAVVGTHTHVQTADEEILENHTGYITDVGMTGPIENSVLGIQKDIIISKFKYYYPQRYLYADGKLCLNAVLMNIDTKTGKCLDIQRLQK